MSYDRDTLVVAAKQLIEDQLSSAISLSSLAKRFNISVRHLNRIFSNQVGCSVGNYIIQRKLNVAKKMLYNPKFSVKEIAYSLGFQRDSYFSYFFKKHTGMTPLEYSKQLNKR
jgi:AraC-like DNA-binding protein